MSRSARMFEIIQLLRSATQPMTAADIAETLEVTKRTIYRDIQALSVTGVPIYTEWGPGGGCALLEHYRTNLNSHLEKIRTECRKNMVDYCLINSSERLEHALAAYLHKREEII